MKSKFGILYASLSAFALLAPMAAQAQQAADESGAGGIEDIVVTAQKRVKICKDPGCRYCRQRRRSWLPQV